MRRRQRIPLLIGLMLLGPAVIVASCGGLRRPTLPPLRLSTRVAGLSGLAVDEEGQLWAVPEERRELLRIDRTTGDVESFPIVGMPKGVEAEALTYAGGNVFMVGTEAMSPNRPTDDVVVLDFADGIARTREIIRCPYSLWGLEAHHNRGLEGLCVVGEDLVVAAEVTGTVHGRRYAPLGRRSPDGQWTAFRIWLTSETGKLAGMSCEPTPDGGAAVLAIERHFGVTRILSFTLPANGAATDFPDIRPEVLVDLDEWVRQLEVQPNFEGIAPVGDDQVALLVDNQYRGERTGPSEVWFVDLDD